MRALFARLGHLLPIPPAPGGIEDGRLYRFSTFWEDGETFLADGDTLVNLTRPGCDLVLAGGQVLTPEGQHYGSVGDLVPVDEA